MDLEQLMTFVLAARTQNFRETGRQRFLNQATVSHHIANLEADLGVVLFQRIGRRVVLTASGHEFVPYAERLLSLAAEGKAKAQKPISHHFVLAASAYAAETIVPWLCRILLSRMPGIDIEIRVMASSEIPTMVSQGGADAGIGREEAHAGPLKSRRLVHDNLVLITAHDGGDWDQSSPVWQALLRDHRLIIQPRMPYLSEIRARCLNEGISLRTMRVTHLAVSKKLVEEGIGVAVVPSLAVTRELMEGRLLAIYPSWLEDLRDALYWITRRDTVNSASVQMAEEALQYRWPQ
ncbi:MAG: hypothetical protein C7B46_11690 [Sulfobacillus benefaciens]|uniref:HTH lysR-type domain-containing protein n=1 Tax=Sulfobacillus benefaciens TaxID=453960 RepID=A0A2T2XF01_9FIRM|nr:MAG: hypothetical protein C7B46_11690 [Sulfobacillus benefaciens]